jgi:sodium-dependent dicarboxylate transporter 2/3/5
MNRLMGNVLALIVFVGVLACPTPAGMTPEAHRLLGITGFMAVLWLTQTIPLGVTSLIPVVTFPLLGIQTAREVSQAYANESIFLLLGGFIIALGIEKWGLHHRMALQIVLVVGTSLKRTILGFMLATAFLSMWISNTASTLLMLPIGLAFLGSLQDPSLPQKSSAADSTDSPFSKLSVVLCLAIAYSASIGGLTTLVGTPANIQFRNIWSDQFPEAPEISAGEWMLAAFPIGVVLLACCWLVLTWRLPHFPELATVDRRFVANKLKGLGPPTRAELMMFGVFSTAALLWIARKPIGVGGGFSIPGWGPTVEQFLNQLGTDATFSATAVGDSTVAILVAIAMFFLPGDPGPNGKRTTLMDWETARTLPWEILLLVGGGFALADAFSATGLSLYAGAQITEVGGQLPILVFIALVCTLLTFLTEFTSNVATVSVLLPILAATAVDIEIDPRVVMIPATLSTTCAFMLPIGTPPNAVVFSSGRVRITQMAGRGLVLNLVGIVVVTAATFLYLVPRLDIDLGAMPAWAIREPLNTQVTE